MTRSLPLLLAAILLVGGCGRVGTLKPADGKAIIPVAAGATRAQTPDELVHPTTQSRPQRNVDILYRSEKRPEDQFELPPGPDNGRPR
ncbi:hypothetical protein BH10PSE13_BH10PSE13_07900 [soil metagenome]